MKEPTPDHPITIEPSETHVTVTAEGTSIGETQSALRLQESTYPAVLYIPRDDVDMSRLERSDHETYCPYKGTANYFHLKTDAGTAENAVWTYESPYPAVAEIKDHLAFYPNAADVTEKIEA